MSYLTENANLPFPITCPITEADRQQAVAFAKQQITAEKAEQVYRNTLAILVAEHYLDMVGIEVDRDRSYSWSGLARLTVNVADLYIPEAKGRLECRAIRAGEQKCLIPAELLDPEAWSDRLGFVVVELNENYTAAKLLGFVPQIGVEELPLSYLRSLDDLLDQVEQWSQNKLVPAVNVSDWFKGKVGQGWKTLKDLTQQFSPNQPQLAHRFRGSVAIDRSKLAKADKQELIKIIETTPSEENRWQAADRLWEIDPEHPACGVSYASVLEGFDDYEIGLIVAGLQKVDGTISFFVRICSLKIEAALPINVEFSLIDKSGVVQYTAKSQPNETCIQKKFSVNQNEEFTVRISWNGRTVEKNFVALSN